MKEYFKHNQIPNPVVTVASLLFCFGRPFPEPIVAQIKLINAKWLIETRNPKWKTDGGVIFLSLHI